MHLAAGRGTNDTKTSLEQLADWAPLSLTLKMLWYFWGHLLVPKVLHLLRYSPSVSHNSLAKFDALLRRSVQHFTNSDLTDIQWIQTSLPVKDGVFQLAISAFLASAESTRSLQDNILAEYVKVDNDFFLSDLSDWSAKFGNIPDVLPIKQPFWDLENRAQLEDNSGHVSSVCTGPLTAAKR